MVSLAFFYRNIFRNAYPQRDSQRSMISNISLSLFFPFILLKNWFISSSLKKRLLYPYHWYSRILSSFLYFSWDPATEVTIFFLPLSKDISCLSELLCFKTLENNLFQARTIDTRKDQKLDRYVFCKPYILSKKNGGRTQNRTGDTRIFSPLLYRLSYPATWYIY